MADHPSWGWWNNQPTKIHIRPEAPPQRISETFIHEIIHAIDDAYLNGELPEMVVSGLSNGLLQVFEQLGVRFVNGNK